MTQRTVEELLAAYMDQEKMHNMEGRKGVQHLCQIAGALGYKDPMHFGQLTNKASVGDLLEMLQDNSGMIDAMIQWIQSPRRNCPQFRDALEELVTSHDLAKDIFEGGVCPDCSEEISPTATFGDECDNCGHIFVWGSDTDLSDELCDEIGDLK